MPVDNPAKRVFLMCKQGCLTDCSVFEQGEFLFFLQKKTIPGGGGPGTVLQEEEV
jgi:hypothetical protein